MPEIGRIGGSIPPQKQDLAAERTAGPANTAHTPPAARNVPIGPPGPLSQPTGLPAPVAPGQTKLLPGVVAERDPSRSISTERLSTLGGTSATEELMGLNRQPSILGAFSTPPGNNEALRHMTPTMRRTIMRSLMKKQRERMHLLARLLRHGSGEQETASEQGMDEPAKAFREELASLDEAQVERVRRELSQAARMLDLLEELLAMQDYTLSQIGSFSQG